MVVLIGQLPMKINYNYYYLTADAICNCPVPTYLNPYSYPDPPLYPPDFDVQDSTLKIKQVYPFNPTYEPQGTNYSTTVSYKNCAIE